MDHLSAIALRNVMVRLTHFGLALATLSLAWSQYLTRFSEKFSIFMVVRQ